MSIAVESLLELKWREGKSFLFLYTNLTLAGGATDRIAICTNDVNITIESINVQSDADSLSWKPYLGTDMTKGSGTAIAEIPRNINAATISSVTSEVNPTIADAGTPFFANPVNIPGQQASGGNSFIDTDIIENLFSLRKNLCHLIDLKNNDTGAVSYTIAINIFKD